MPVSLPALLPDSQVTMLTYLFTDKAYEKVYDKIPHVSSGRPKDGAQHAKVVELNDANQCSVRKRKEMCATAVVILTSIAALLLCARVLVVSPFQQENKSGTKLGDGREKRVDLFDEYGM